MKRTKRLPAREDFYIPRKGLMTRCRDTLLKQSPISSTGNIVALVGAGGSGKTTLAREICDDLKILRKYHDGVFWIDLKSDLKSDSKSEVDLINTIRNIIIKITGNPLLQNFISAEDAGMELCAVLDGKRILFVIDDLWNRKSLHLFQIGGKQCGCLVTTRNSDLLPPEIVSIKVEEMECRDEALKLILHGLPFIPSAQLENLALKILGKWPMLLKLANRQLGYLYRENSLDQKEVKLNEAVVKLIKKYREKGLEAFDVRNPEERNDAIFQSIDVSVDFLDDKDKNYFFSLAVFPKRIDIPFQVIEQFWKSKFGKRCVDVEAELLYFSQHSLLSKFISNEKVIQLHDFVREYLVEKVPNSEEKKSLHICLLDGYDRERIEGSGFFKDDDEYIIRWYIYHMCEAGETDKLNELLLNYNWINQKIDIAGIGSLLADFENATSQKETSSFSLIEIKDVQAILELAAGVLCKHKDQLAEQLLGRLQNIPRTNKCDLITQIEKTGSWLQPVFSNLRTPPSIEKTLPKRQEDFVNCLVVHPNQKEVITGGSDSQIILWDLERCDGECFSPNSEHSGWINALAFASEKGQLISGISDGRIAFYDLRSYEKFYETQNPGGGVYSLAINPNESLLIVSSIADALYILNLENYKWQKMSESGENLGYVRALLFHPDGRLITGSMNNSIMIWDMESRRIQSTLPKQHTKPVVSLALDSDKQKLYSGSMDGIIIEWDLQKKDQPHIILDQNNSIESMAIAPNSQQLIFGLSDGSINVLKISEKGEKNAIADKIGSHAGIVRTLGIVSQEVTHFRPREWNDPGKEVFIISGGTDGLVKRHNLSRWESLKSSGKIESTHLGSVEALAIHPNEDFAVSASVVPSDTIKVWDLQSGSFKELTESSLAVKKLIFSRDGKFLISVSTDQFKKWDFLSGKEINKSQSLDLFFDLPYFDDEGIVSISPYSQFLLIRDSTFSNYRIFNPLNKESHSLPSDYDGCDLVASFSNNNQWLVTTLRKNGISVWNLSEYIESRIMDNEINCNVISISVSNDGKRVVAILNEGRILLFDMIEKECIAHFYGDYEYKSCAISADGRYIITGDQAGGINILKVMNG